MPSLAELERQGAWPAGWTDQQKADYYAVDKADREAVLGLMQVARAADVIQLIAFSQTRVDPAVDALPKGTLLPCCTDWAAAVAITKEEQQETRGLLRQLAGLMESKRQLLVKLVGINAGE